MRVIHTLIISILFVFCVFPATVWACSCMEKDLPEAAMKESEAVFLGVVESFTEEIRTRTLPDDNGKNYNFQSKLIVAHFKMEKSWKGVLQKTYAVRYMPGMCGPNFEKGERYLVYTYMMSGGDWTTTSGCSRTGKEDHSGAEMLLLDWVIAGVPEKETFSRLVSLFREHSNSKVRIDAMRLIHWEGRKYLAPDVRRQVLLQALEDTHYQVRLAGLYQLYQFKVDAEIISSILAILKDDEAELRAQAATALSYRSKKDSRILPALRAAWNAEQKIKSHSSPSGLKKDSSYVLPRLALTLVLAGDERDRETHWGFVMESFRGKDKEFRWSMRNALKSLGPYSQKAVPELITIMKDQQIGVDIRRDALQTLREIEPVGKEVVSVMIDILKSGDPALSGAAETALYFLGIPEAEAAVRKYGKFNFYRQ